MSDYEEIRERLLELLDGERVTFADRVHILDYLDKLNEDNECMSYLCRWQNAVEDMQAWFNDDHNDFVEGAANG